MRLMCPQSVADDIIEQLLDNGITVQTYSSVTTKSVYIKADYGVLGSIRISDHKGKRHLKYRYNIQRDVRSYYRKGDMEFFPVTEVGRVVARILQHKDALNNKFGPERYKEFQQERRDKSEGSKGFWSAAHTLKPRQLRKGVIVIAEGYNDAAKLMQVPFVEDVVVTDGTKFKKKTRAKIQEYLSKGYRVIIATDPDEAGDLIRDNILMYFDLPFLVVPRKQCTYFSMKTGKERYGVEYADPRDLTNALLEHFPEEG